MALTRTNRITAVGTPTTASFTPSDSSLLVVVSGVQTTNPGYAWTNLTVASSAGLTFTSRIGWQPSTPEFSEYWWNIRIWTAPVTTGVSMTVTCSTSSGSINTNAIAVVDYTGYDTGTPTGATAAEDLVDDGADSITLSGTPSATSEIIGACASGVSAGSDSDATPDTGHTELYNINSAFNGHLQVQVRDIGSTSTTFGWSDVESGGATLYDTIGVALEIIESGGGGAPDLDLPLLQAPHQSNVYRM